jgi:hypothetical protein
MRRMAAVIVRLPQGFAEFGIVTGRKIAAQNETNWPELGHFSGLLRRTDHVTL